MPGIGDIIWMNFNPSKGSEQKGKRPALVVTDEKYNRFGLCYVLPITTKIKGYPIEVLLPDEAKTKGVILTNQMLAIDFESRQVSYIEGLDKATLDIVKSRLRTILQL